MSSSDFGIRTTGASNLATDRTDPVKTNSNDHHADALSLTNETTGSTRTTLTSLTQAPQLATITTQENDTHQTEGKAKANSTSSNTSIQDEKKHQMVEHKRPV